MSATTETRHPCAYCGTMLDEDDCVESDIPAVNGPMLHSESQCRELVYYALRYVDAELAQARAAVERLTREATRPGPWRIRPRRGPCGGSWGGGVASTDTTTR